jgi:hypothetical protein
MEHDRTYFMRRAAQERSAANRARGKARKAHEQMAECYHNLVGSDDTPSHPEPAASA